MTEPTSYEWISVDELVRRTNKSISLSTIYRWAKQGLIPRMQLCKGCKMMVRSDSFDLLQKTTEAREHAVNAEAADA